MESEGMFVDICATTGIAASLYRNGRTVHSFLGIGVEDADSNERHTKLSSYGPNSERAKVICCLSFLVFDEASMLKRLLFEHIDAIVKDLRCSHMRSQGGGNDTDRRDNPDLRFFGGISIVFAGDYLQSLPIMASRNVIELPNGGKSIVLVCLLDELPWRSSPWERVKVFRMTQQRRQSEDTVFSTLLKQTATGRLSQECPLPRKSTGNISQSYKCLWQWVDSGKNIDVDPDRIIVC